MKVEDEQVSGGDTGVVLVIVGRVPASRFKVDVLSFSSKQGKGKGREGESGLVGTNPILRM